MRVTGSRILATVLVVLVAGVAVTAGGVAGTAVDSPATGAQVSETGVTPQAGAVVDLSHDQTVGPDGSFEITVETTNTSGTTVEVAPSGFDVELDSEDAVETDGNLIRFLDPSAGDSTYTITVNVVGGSDGDVGEITAWVNAEDRADADDEGTSTFELGGDSNTGDDRVSLDHPTTVSPDGSFEMTVETVDSSGTTVEVAPSGFDVELESEDAVETDGNLIRFLDPSAGNSTYTIAVDVTGGSDADTGEIVAWVNAENRADADDEVTTSFELNDSDGPGDDGPGDVTGNGKPAQDLNDDGLYRDINGDDEFNIFDVQALFSNLNEDAVQDNAAAFNFAESDAGEVTIFDVQSLFGELGEGIGQ